MTSRPKLSHALLAMLIEELMEGGSTSFELAAITGLSEQTIRQVLRALHKRGVIHVCSWEKGGDGRMNVRAYALGRGKDIPKPVKKRAAVNRDYQRRRKADLLPIAFGLGA